MTVAELRKVLDKLPDDAEVYYQRIEDVYFDHHGWDKTVVLDAEDDEYVGAYTAFKAADGSKLFITAHY